MADSGRTPADSLKNIEALQAEPYRYNFFSAIRMLDCAFADRPRTGTASRPSQEAIRIGQLPTLKFAPASLAAFRQQQGHWYLQTYFFGLFGPNAPLPLHLTDYAHQRLQHHRDLTLMSFADVFHHRMATFFYRAWADSQPTVQLDRPESDCFKTYVGALCGYGMSSLYDRDEMPDNAKLFYCGHLSKHTRYSSGLQSILQSFFQAAVEIIPFVQHWVHLPEDCLWKLGRSAESGTLGQSITLGSRVSDCQQRFCIAIGPLDLDAYRRLLPKGDSMRRLTSIVANYVGMELSWVVKLILQKEEVPSMQLGRQGQLGWTTWLASRPPHRDADQLVVNPQPAGCYVKPGIDHRVLSIRRSKCLRLVVASYSAN